MITNQVYFHSPAALGYGGHSLSRRSTSNQTNSSNFKPWKPIDFLLHLASSCPRLNKNDRRGDELDAKIMTRHPPHSKCRSPVMDMFSDQ